MEGNITIAKNALESFKKVCEDRFNGTYEIKETHKLGYVITLKFIDIQDVFSLGQIFEQERSESDYLK